MSIKNQLGSIFGLPHYGLSVVSASDEIISILGVYVNDISTMTKT
jgi:hypothetical protein